MLIEFTNEFTKENTQTIMKEEGENTPNLSFFSFLFLVKTPHKPMTNETRVDKKRKKDELETLEFCYFG